MPKKPSARTSNPYQAAAGSGEPSPARQIAFEIVADRRDLLPSVDHIMNAGLDGDATVAALGLFRAALTTPGDPNRDPRVAVGAAAPPQ